MNTACWSRAKPRVLALCVAAVLGLGSGGAAAESLPAAAKPAAADAARPIPPSKAELVDSAFKKLALGKDYVAREDAKTLDGFVTIFDATDANHDGRLSFEEFKKAWAAYAASEKSDRG